MISFLDLKNINQQYRQQLIEACTRVIDSGWYIGGTELEQFEQNFAKYCGTQYAIGVANGLDALILTLRAWKELGKLQDGDEVIVPSNTYIASILAITANNLTPVLVEPDINTYNIDPAKIQQAITANTRVILPVHLYGQAADMTPIMEIANEHGIPVIEDCAQAIGADYSNQKAVGSMGLMGCYSFYPTKNLGAFGDGGLVVTNDEATYTKLMQMRNHGMEPKYHHKFVGGNFRLDAIQAAVLNVKFQHLESWHEKRRQNAALYSKFFKEAGLAEKSGMTEFNDKNKVLMPKSMYKKSGVRNYHIFNQYIIRVENRDEMRAFLSANSIGSEIYYPVPFHKQECFAYLGSNASHFPVSTFAAEHSIALPIFPELQEEQIAFVVEKIAEFVRK